MFHKDQIYSFPYPNQLFLCLSVTKTCIYKLQHVEYEETFLLAVELDVWYLVRLLLQYIRSYFDCVVMAFAAT